MIFHEFIRELNCFQLSRDSPAPYDLGNGSLLTKQNRIEINNEQRSKKWACVCSALPSPSFDGERGMQYTEMPWWTLPGGRRRRRRQSDACLAACMGLTDMGDVRTKCVHTHKSSSSSSNSWRGNSSGSLRSHVKERRCCTLNHICTSISLEILLKKKKNVGWAFALGSGPGGLLALARPLGPAPLAVHWAGGALPELPLWQPPLLHVEGDQEDSQRGREQVKLI